MAIEKFIEFPTTQDQLTEIALYNKGEINWLERETFWLLHLVTSPGSTLVLGRIENQGVDKGYCRFGRPYPQEVLAPVEDHTNPSGVYEFPIPASHWRAEITEIPERFKPN